METYWIKCTLVLFVSICCAKALMTYDKDQAAREKEKLEKLTKYHEKNLCDNYLSKNTDLLLKDGGTKRDVSGFNNTCRVAVSAFIASQKSPEAAMVIVHSYKPYTRCDDLTVTKAEVKQTLKSFESWDEETIIRLYSCVREKENRSEIVNEAIAFADNEWWKKVLTEKNIAYIRNKFDIEKIIQWYRYKTTFPYVANLKSLDKLKCNVWTLLEFDAKREKYVFNNENDFKDFVNEYYCNILKENDAREILSNKHLSDTPLDIVKLILKSPVVKTLVESRKFKITALCSMIGHCQTKECFEETIKALKPEGTVKPVLDTISFGILIKQAEQAKVEWNNLLRFVTDLNPYYGSPILVLNYMDERSIKFVILMYQKWKLNESYAFIRVKELMKKATISHWDLPFVEQFVERTHKINLFPEYYENFFKVMQYIKKDKVMGVVELLESCDIKEHRLWNRMADRNIQLEEVMSVYISGDAKLAIKYYLTNRDIKKCDKSALEIISKYGKINQQEMTKEIYQTLFDKACDNSKVVAKISDAVANKTPVAKLEKEISKIERGFKWREVTDDRSDEIKAR